MATRMQQRRGTASQWTTANPVLAAGEIGFETDTSKFKIGDSVNTWDDLEYFTSAAEIANIIDGAPDLLNTLNELAAAVNDDPTFFTTVATNLSDHESDTLNIHGISDTAELATKTFANTAVSNHQQDTTEVHGIADTAELATKTYADTAVSTHNDDTTNVHGIADTSLLATTAYVDTAETDAITAATAAAETAADNAVSTHNSATTNIHGIADTSALATTSATTSAISTAVSDHNTDTTSVHGIADTSLLATSSELGTAVSDHAAITTNIHGIADVADLALKSGTTMTGDLTLAGDPSSNLHAATKAYVDSAISTHDLDTTGVHGITDTAELATKTYADDAVSTHNSDTTNVHGIADTSVLATVTNVSDALTDAEDYADSQIDAHVAVTTNVHGIADTSKLVLTDALTTTLDGALIVDGNLTVNGTEFIASATSITIEDNILQLAHNQSGNSVDLGLVVAYNDGTYHHSGIVRDVSANTWKLFKDVETDPTTTVAFDEGSLDDLELNNVKAAGVIFTDGTQTKEGVVSRTPIIQKTASYTLSALDERDNLIEMASSSAMTLTIPTDATLNFPIGTSLDILQTSTGQVTIAGSGGVTVNATPGLKLRTTWSSATLFKRAEDTWVVYGDLTA